MFIVCNKDKIASYMVSFFTVMILLGIAFYMRNNSKMLEVSSTSEQLPIYSVKTDEKKVAFTMNCAWNADDIDQILKTLEENDVKITFFMVGDWVDKYPEAVKKISDAGHEIGNHSNTHPHVNNLTYEKNISEIEECNKKIEKITGKKSKVYRGPYGEYNDNVINAAEAVNSKTIQWSLDTLDYKDLTGEEMWKRLDKKIEPGSIILSHNGTKHTADSLDYLIKNIKKSGYKIVTVSDLIYQSDYYIDNTGKQIKK